MSVIYPSYWEQLIGFLSYFWPRSQNISAVRVMTVWRISQFSLNWSNIFVRIIFVDLLVALNVRLLTFYLLVSGSAFTVRKLLECDQVMRMVVAVVKDLDQFTWSNWQQKYHQESQPVHLVNIMEK